ncbi:CLUMA_CG017072, isoform A [Clunio marinus]|uniref:CLUMA_CG017072, isoform A n=1 Tax=Clunio marinus TaxID=568069 RepID=A0A1J1IUU2_9DIPT|nr:CLUMA_CG017072, isoform A [Clunio marinus]
MKHIAWIRRIRSKGVKAGRLRTPSDIIHDSCSLGAQKASRWVMLKQKRETHMSFVYQQSTVVEYWKETKHKPP